jgi:dGTPase
VAAVKTPVKKKTLANPTGPAKVKTTAPVKASVPPKAKATAPAKVDAVTDSKERRSISSPTAALPVSRKALAKSSPKVPQTEKLRKQRLHPRTAARDDDRDAFQRDRDRVLYSTYFRRLAGITQVVHAGEGHVFHNRMTHSIKVAQVARRLAEYIVEASDPDELSAIGGLNPDVAETAGLCHDIGHPPFGHAAEYELQDQFEERNISDGFEGNAQSFRIITKLALRDLESPGLNLSAASLCAILKYPWARAVQKHEKANKKFGFYESEAKEFAHARSFLPVGDRRQSLEANVMDWSDDISYAVHDVDDAYRAGLVPLDRLVQDEEERERFVAWYAESEIRSGREKFDTEPKRNDFEKSERAALPQTKKQMHATLLEFVDIVHAPRRPFRGTREDIAHLHHYSSTLLTRYLTIDEEHLQLNSSDTGDRLIVPKTLRAQVNMLKKVMVFYVYESPALVAQQVGQRAIIKELFARLYEGAKEGAGHGAGLIPEPFLETLREIHSDKPPTFERDCARLAADIICSLTEQQAVDFYRRLTGHFAGTIRDQIVY